MRQATVELANLPLGDEPLEQVLKAEGRPKVVRIHDHSKVHMNIKTTVEGESAVDKNRLEPKWLEPKWLRRVGAWAKPLK